MNETTSHLVRDLNHLPGILAGFASGIAAAQRAANLDYLEGVERIAALAARFPAGAAADAAAELLRHLIAAASPARYQFTETTFTVRLDLAQSMSVAGQAGAGVGWGAAVVNASFAAAYGYDYRAAAEIRCVLHAVPPDAVIFQTLLGRARELGTVPTVLPAPTEEAAAIARIFGKES